MQARYLFEHQFIPNLLYSEDRGILFLAALMKEGAAFLLRAFADLWSRTEDSDFPYTENDLSVHPIRCEAKGDRPELCFIAVRMPEPESFCQCSSVFLCYDRNIENFRYFTKELSFDDTYMLCSWTADGSHLNHGEAPDGNEALFDKICSLYYGK